MDKSVSQEIMLCNSACLLLLSAILLVYVIDVAATAVATVIADSFSKHTPFNTNISHKTPMSYTTKSRHKEIY